MRKQELMKELLDRYQQLDFIKDTDAAITLDMYIEKLERELRKELAK